MHISEGILSPPILIGGYIVAGTFTAIGFKKLEIENLPATAVMSALIFLASFIHVPIGPTSAHLVLNGFAGAILGILSFPAALIALLLQALLFQFGGLTTLGITTFNIAFPAFLMGILYRKTKTLTPFYKNFIYFLIGFLGVFLSSLLVAITLALNGESLRAAAGMIFAAHIPIMIIEGIVTLFMLNFIHKMKIGVFEID